MSKKKVVQKSVVFPTSIRFPEELLNFLKAKASERYTTVTNVVIEMTLQFKAFDERVPKKK